MTATGTLAPVRCQRPGCTGILRSQASRERGMSDRCWRLARIEAIEQAIAGYSEQQQEKALDLLASGGLRPTSRPGTWLADSSDGTTTYVVDANGCRCESRLQCYHMAARAGAMAVLALTPYRLALRKAA